MCVIDYYAFGTSMSGRKYESGLYRYGFNGKENDSNGEFGSQLIQDYGFRMYNPAIARFLSVDPLMKSYPSWSPYPFAMNRVIDGIDLDGLEWKSTNEWSDKVSESDLKDTYGEESVYNEDTGETTPAWERHSGESYGDMWKNAVPGMQNAQYYTSSKPKVDCADFSINLLVEFAYENGLPVHFSDYKKEADPTFDNDDYGYTDKAGNSHTFEEGDWKGLADAIASNYGAGDFHSKYSKFTTQVDDKSKVEPGDLITTKWHGSGGFHNQTVGWVFNKEYQGESKRFFSLVQGGLSGGKPILLNKGLYEVGGLKDSDFIKHIQRIHGNGIETEIKVSAASRILVKKWNFKFFDSKF